jgi:hypothetical protein
MAHMFRFSLGVVAFGFGVGVAFAVNPLLPF